MVSNYHNPFLITGVERSGSTLIAKILDLCGVYSGVCNNMFENKDVVKRNNSLLGIDPLKFPKSEELLIPVNFKASIDLIYHDIIKTNKPWMIKHSTLARLYPVWKFAYPNSKWIIVRRRTGDIVRSCVQTGYMTLFKDVRNLAQIGQYTESNGWLWWVHRYEQQFLEMIDTGLDYKIIWPDRMVIGDYSQVQELVSWLGLEWNPDIPSIIGPLLINSKDLSHENNS